MASVKVFGSPTSAEVARVLTCLFEKDVEFQLIRVENFKGGKRKPEYLKLQVLLTSAFTLELFYTDNNLSEVACWNGSDHNKRTLM